MKNSIKYMSLIIVSCLFLGIGYSKISDINLLVNGSAKLDKNNSVLIIDSSIISSTGVDKDLSKINNYFQSNLDSIIELNDETSSVNVQVILVNNTNSNKVFKGIIYDDAFYDNENITFDLEGINVDDTLTPKEEVQTTLTFRYKNYYPTVNKILSSVLNFHFEDANEETYLLDGICRFNGPGQDIEGDCANGQHIDYINTGISLFSEETYLKDFELYFEIDNIDPTRFRSGQVDTVFHALLEQSPYPGILLRIQDSKWLLQIGNGVNNKKIKFNPGELNSLKILRISGKIYYQVNKGETIFATDMTNLTSNFNSPMVIGTALDINNNPVEAKYLVGDLKNISLHVYENGIGDLDSWYEQLIKDFISRELTEVYNLDTHTYDGTQESGVNTNVYLFSEENYQKDFLVSLTLDSVNITELNNQATLFNAKDETNITYPGLVLRKSTDKYELAMKDGLGQISSVNIPKNARKINIIRKNNEYFYQYDYSDIKPLGQNNNFSNFPIENCFEIGATFGSNIDENGNFSRVINGTLTNMKISIG